MMIDRQVKLVTRVPALSVAIGLMALACACGGGNQDDAAGIRTQGNVVAGPGEKTFTDKYGLSWSLPIAEADFLLVLNRLNLRYRVDRERGVSAVIPVPRKGTSLDISSIQRIYVIDGGYDPIHRVTERYRAYVNRERQIVYIENNFVYPSL